MWLSLFLLLLGSYWEEAWIMPVDDFAQEGVITRSWYLKNNGAYGLWCFPFLLVFSLTFYDIQQYVAQQ